tara:strand:+ start:149152 stop:149958 length:807 start_codon:yes stop_codon:yes gene_type:complete
LFFSCFNWFFEILKWKTLVSYCKKITFVAAAKQSLGSLTASLFTPNRIGEYGAKAIYYKKGTRKKIMLLNLISNSTQMGVTVLFGSIGLLYFLLHFDVTIELFSLRKLAYLMVLLILLIVLGSTFGFKKIRGFYIDKIIHFIKNIPAHIQFKNVLFSIIRYLIFSHQFYFLVYTFGIQTDYHTAMALISSMYLLASLVPSLSFFDWLIKGSVAVWVFSFIQADELIIITITLVMWLLNFGIPAIFGSYYVLNFNFSATLEPTKEQHSS